MIGRAARAAAGDPGQLQLIKYLWHILVLLGTPADQPATSDCTNRSPSGHGPNPVLESR